MLRDAERDVDAVGTGIEQCRVGVEPLDAIQSARGQLPFPGPVAYRAQQRGVGKVFAHQAVGIGVAREHRAFAVDDGDRRAGGHVHGDQQFVQPAEIERHEHDAARFPCAVAQAMCNHQCRFAGDAADLEIADGEPGPGHGLAKITAIGNVDPLLHRCRAADDIAVCIGDAHVDVVGEWPDQGRDETLAARGSSRPLGRENLDGVGEEVAGLNQQFLLLRGPEPYQAQRLLFGGHGAIATLFPGHVGKQHHRRHKRQQHEQHEARAQSTGQGRQVHFDVFNDGRVRRFRHLRHPPAANPLISF
jgi:hypothetical protein